MVYKWIVTGKDIGYDSPTRGETEVFGKFTSLAAARGHLNWEVSRCFEEHEDESQHDIYSGGTIEDGEVEVQWEVHGGPDDGKHYGKYFRIEEIEPEKVEME
jgi:hypothetical protein